MGIEGYPRKRKPGEGLVYEAPPTRKLAGHALETGMILAESGAKIRQILNHSSDEVMVILEGGGSRTFSRTEPEAEVLDV